MTSSNIILVLNGKETSAPDNISVEKLIALSGHEDKMVAVAVNGCFIPKSTYESHYLKNYDKIEIVAPMQGG